ncbi:MAG: flagellar basal body P-ring formation protein FlgA [Acidobacteria bacterium]|nr:flagellar basal body P-ring formation protein FlgA [Acidobacteriota bacterium]
MLLFFVCPTLRVLADTWPPVSVQLNAHTVIDQPIIHLQDIAEISTTDSALRKTLAAVVIGNAPEPGLKRVLTRRHLLTRLPADSVKDRALRLIGPDEIVVTRRCQALSPESVSKAIRDYIVQNTRWTDNQIIIKSVRFPTTLLPSGAIAARVEAKPAFQVRDRFYVTLIVYREAERLRTVLVEVTAEVWANVAVTARTLVRGETIRPDMIRWERRNLTQLPDDIFLLPQGMIGAVAAKPVEQGRPLVRPMLTRPQWVNRGEVVTLVTEGEHFRITTKAKARTAGKSGDVIEVSNLESGKWLQAEVIGPREVRTR